MTRAPAELIVVSNGHGEDTIACRVLDALVPQLPAGAMLSAWPMVGQGAAYRARGISVEGPANLLPGEGFGTLDARLFWRDLRAGFIATHWHQLRHARALRGRARLMLGVGDVIPLLAAGLAATPMAFIACAKSVHYGGREARAGGHGVVERALMRRWCTDVFARDGLTAHGLAARAIPARDLGNPMMDGLDRPEGPALLAPGVTGIAALPGTRADATANAGFLLDGALAFDALGAETMPPAAFLFALTPAVDMRALAQAALRLGWQRTEPAAGLPADTVVLQAPRGTRALLLTGSFAAILHASAIAVGLAGTANEQAIGLGLPLITAPGAGNQGAAYLRMKMRYFGEAAQAVPRDPARLAVAISALLADPARQHRMAQAGRARMGGPGASAAIAAVVLERFLRADRRDGGMA